MTAELERNAEVEPFDFWDLAPDPGASQEAADRIRKVARLAELVDGSSNEAEAAAAAARLAKSKSPRIGQKKEAIEALQDSGVASSEALVLLAESQKHLFDNQQALAQLIRELTGYALGSIANTRAVCKQLEAALSGASSEELNELAKRELQGVMLEFKRQLDLAERQERTDKKLWHLREQLNEQLEVAGELLQERHRLQEQVRNATVVAIIGVALGVAAMLLAILS